MGTVRGEYRKRGGNDRAQDDMWVHKMNKETTGVVGVRSRVYPCFGPLATAAGELFRQ